MARRDLVVDVRAADLPEVKTLIGRLGAVAQALADAADEMEDMLPYIPDWAREKWRYDDAVARARDALANLEGGA